MKRYPHIFKPFRCKSLELKNRIVMMPMGTNYGEQTGEMSFLHIHYYEMRAKGGTGLIIMENACFGLGCPQQGGRGDPAFSGQRRDGGHCPEIWRRGAPGCDGWV